MADFPEQPAVFIPNKRPISAKHASKNGPEVAGVNTSGLVADIDTFLLQTQDGHEAQYLCAFLNAPFVDETIKPHQTRGQWGERHIYRRPFEVMSIPKFDPEDKRHQKLAEISKECHQKVAKLALTGKSIGFLRNKVRDYLSRELAGIDKIVRDILSTGVG